MLLLFFVIICYNKSMKKFSLTMKIIRRTVLLVLFGLLIYSLVSAGIENNKIDKELSEFMSKGVLQEDFSTKYQKFYIVPRETWQEPLDSFYIDSTGELLPGQPGDILCARKAAIENVPIVSDFITYNFGGHAIICADDFEDSSHYITKRNIIEATGMSETKNEVVYSGYSMRNLNAYRTTVMGLRVKCDADTRQKALQNAYDMLENPYNYSFVLDTKNRDYCSDIMSKAYGSLGINLNYDGIATTIQDLCVSKNTYYFFYRYKDKDNVMHIYYLDDLDNRQVLK